MNKPGQRLVVIVLALLLALPLGIAGIGALRGGDSSSQDTPVPEGRRAMDPADQPPRPELPRPEDPPELTEQSAAGAEATLTHLLLSYDYMMSSGDTEVWRQSVNPKCRVCLSFLDNAEVLKDQGGYLVGGAFEVHDASFEGTGEPPATGTVTADFTQAESTLVDDPNLEPLPLESVSGQIIATVAWDGERWRVTDMAIAPPGGPSDGGGASDS